MNPRTLKVAAASAVAVGALGVGGATMALAADATPTPSPSASASGDGTAKGEGRGGSHTEVTGDEADEVSAAVEATDSAVTIESVRKDEDGSYDAMGTKDGEKVAFDVSADLATVTERTGGPGGRHGGRGGGSHTEVTGDEADKVSAAVEATDPTVTIESVRKDEDGSYDAMGTKDGEKVAFDVSADLATVTERTGGPGRHGGHGGTDDGSTSPDDTTGTSEPSATATATSV